MESIIDFSAPPVTEVVAGISFHSLGPEGVALVSGFWREVARETFPQLQVQPPYTPPIERLNAPPGLPQLTYPGMQLVAGYPAPRFWAIAEDGQHLLQLQPDWFACNWRRVRPQDEYDRWQRRRDDFRLWYERLSSYVGDRTGTRLKPMGCEVTYINHVAPAGDFKTHADFGRVFNLPIAGLDLPPEQLSATLRYAVPSQESNGRTAGWLDVDIKPALDQKSQPIYLFQLTVRGTPQDESLDAVLSFMDLGRKTIDESFVALTTTDIQREWGRRND